jgi:hypothetical protein
VDFCPFQPQENQDVDQALLRTWAKQEEEKQSPGLKVLLRSLKSDLEAMVLAYKLDRVPVVYACGTTMQTLLRRFYKLEDIGMDACKFHVGERLVVAVTRPHPSAHLMAGQSPSIVANFSETCALLKAVAFISKKNEPHVTELMVTEAIAKVDLEMALLRREKEAGAKWLYLYLFGKPNSWFPIKARTLRLLPLDDEEFVDELLAKFAKLSKEVSY